MGLKKSTYTINMVCLYGLAAMYVDYGIWKGYKLCAFMLQYYTVQKADERCKLLELAVKNVHSTLWPRW